MNRRRFDTPLFCLAALVLAACSNTPRNPYEDIDLKITGLAIINQTRGYISAAQLTVPATGNFVSCGNIAPGNICSTSFPEREFTGNPVVVSWSQGGRIHTTGELDAQPSQDVIDEGAAIVRIMIVPGDIAGLELVPTSAGIFSP